MTNSQVKAIESIRALCEKEMRADQEFKVWEITENKYFISLFLSYGMIGDEGTLAAAIARDEAHLFIGKRGAITYPVHKNGRTFTRKFKGYSILQVVCDQAY